MGKIKNLFEKMNENRDENGYWHFADCECDLEFETEDEISCEIEVFCSRDLYLDFIPNFKEKYEEIAKADYDKIDIEDDSTWSEIYFMVNKDGEISPDIHIVLSIFDEEFNYYTENLEEGAIDKADLTYLAEILKEHLVKYYGHNSDKSLKEILTECLEKEDFYGENFEEKEEEMEYDE